jgi:aconitate hydratase
VINLYSDGAYIKGGKPVAADKKDTAAREKTIAYSILRAHDKGTGGNMMNIAFDAMVSHDITYVGIIQTARASGMTEFPLPYALTNCHNSLCAVGGTINQDDHVFGLSAAKKYGGIYVPANQAVIHQYAREALAGCGRMILGSDSHTRYGCYGTMGVGEGGGELAKQLLKNTWDIENPEVVLVWLEGEVPHGIGPHDIAIALVGATFPDGFVKNRVLEFAGPGIKNLSMDFRIGIDVMTTETSCLTSIWETDGTVEKFFKTVGRPEAYKKLGLTEGAYYDRVVKIDLSQAEAMIALPFHPSRAFTVHELQADPERILRETEEICNASLGGQVKMDLCRTINDKGQIMCDQGVIVGCAGGMYENIAEAAAILKGKSIGDGYFDMSVYPSSTPIERAMIHDGIAETLLDAGAVIKPAFCGPCFGAGDTPANNGFSIRHATRNFANREGSKPANGQIAAVALMDARSIAATAANGGILTAATDIDYDFTPEEFVYESSIYEKRCYNGWGNPCPEEELRLGPNITDWPKMPEMKDGVLVRLTAVIHDEVTTTDELIPSGETSSYRSNPVALSEFALSRKAPDYVGNCKAVRDGLGDVPEELGRVKELLGLDGKDLTVGSCVFSRKPGDGSAREQAASCQKVLGGFANICYEYATKRYRSNCINWGIIPFTIDKSADFPYKVGDWVYIPNVKNGILEGRETFAAKVVDDSGVHDITLNCAGLNEEEREILTRGCLINYYAASLEKNK